MSVAPLSAERALAEQIEIALGEHASSADLVQLVIRCGWQPRPVPDPDSDYLEGVLDDGTRVPIEIRRALVRRAG